MKTHQIIICGTGLAGLRTCAHLRELGYTGTITAFGAETHPPYDRPPLSKQILGDYRQPLSAQGLGELSELADEIIIEPVTELRPGAVLAGGRSYPADVIVAATGAEPRQLRENSHVLRTRADAEAIRALREVEILGAGWIGCELAAALARGGRTVTLTEVTGTALPALGPAGRPVTDYLADLGVTIAAGSEPTTGLPLIEAIGVRPRTLGADLRTDLWGRTSVPGRYAVGDCATIMGGPRPGHWNTALRQAERVARAIMADRSGEPLPDKAPLITDVFSTIGELDLLFIGSAHGQLVTAGDDDRFRAVWLDKGTLSGALTINRPADAVAARKNLGRPLTGELAGIDRPLKKLLREAARE
ncbi:MAG: FAD-dependent oxidoreductase [Flaviflexus sp.]|nr:FAD-dependent oxidoreductase [Flaviflexus sp.]